MLCDYPYFFCTKPFPESSNNHDLSLKHLGKNGMFRGFSPEFYSNYHQLIPKDPGFDQRQSVYALFHVLNDWNHFDKGHKSRKDKQKLMNIMKSRKLKSISIMTKLTK